MRGDGDPVRGIVGCKRGIGIAMTLPAAWESNIPFGLGLIPAEKIDILVTVATHDCRNRGSSRVAGEGREKARNQKTGGICSGMSLGPHHFILSYELSICFRRQCSLGRSMDVWAHGLPLWHSPMALQLFPEHPQQWGSQQGRSRPVFPVGQLC